MFDDDEDEDVWGSISDPTEGLGPEIPSVRIPDASNAGGADSDVPKEVAVTFWGLVVTLNLALFAVSLGLMLAYFRGQLRLGGGLFGLGVLALAYAYYKYRRYLNRNDEDDGNDGKEWNEGDDESSENRTSGGDGDDGRERARTRR